MTNRWGTIRRAVKTSLQNRPFRRLLPAYFLFSCGETGIWLAISVFAYRRGGITAVGLVSVAQLIPAVIVAPLGAALSDRAGRATALAIGYGLQFLTAALLAAFMLEDAPAAVYASAIASSCAITLTRPVHFALLPQLATTPEELTAANSLSSMAGNLGAMMGPALTALLLAVLSIASVPALFAATFAIAALLAVFARPVKRAATTRRAPGAAIQTNRGRSTGLGELLRDRSTSLLVILGGGQYFIVGLIDVFCITLAVEVLGQSEGVSGVLLVAGGVGALLGAVASAVLIARTRMTPGIVVGIAVTGIGVGLTPYSPSLAAMVIVIGIAEAGRAFFDVASRALLQRTVAPHLLARLLGVQEGLVMLSLAIGAAAAPLLASSVGIEQAFLVSMAFILLVGALSWPALRRLDLRAVLPDPTRIGILRRVPIFAPLPQHELEQVAGQLLPIAVPAGTVVIREGDIGDRFYVVERGQAAVEFDRRPIATCDPGGYFGEIALLRDIPRTATVTAVTDLSLLALDRDEFLAAVTRSAAGAAAANAEIDRRMTEL